MVSLELLLRKIIGDPKDIPLEHRVFNIAALVGVFMCSTAVLLNLFIFESAILIIAPLLMLGMTIFLYYVSAFRKRHLCASYAALILLTFVLYPVIWIENGGSMGPVFMYYLLNGMLIPFLLLEGRKYLMMGLNVLALGGLYVFEYMHPERIVLYNSLESRLMDHGISFIILFVVVFFLTQSVMNEYRSKVEELKEVQAILKHRSERDSLTGIFNRGYIIESIDTNIEKKDPAMASLIMLDIDDFKQINDNYGHHWGDRVIVDVAKTVSSLIRQTDIVGRIGGEEFLVYLPGCNQDAAASIAEEIRKSIETITWVEPGLKVTVSIGVVSYEKNTSIEAMLQKVDGQMYKAKNSGKNKVSIAVVNV